jgi:hypothetical protein
VIPTRPSIAGAVLALLFSIATAGAGAEEAKKYPAFAGMWNRASKPSTWDVTKPAGPGQQAPLKPEYQAIYADNRAKQKSGQYFDPQAACKPTGMPRMMTIYDPMEIVVTPAVTYMLLEATSPIRRIFTDGRSWPQDPNPGFAGISHGTWIDTSGSGTYDRLEVETRFLKGRRIVEATGIPLAEDGSTIIKERLWLDPKDPDLMHNEITTIDDAFTRPWTVERQYRREHDPVWEEYNCMEDNRWVVLGGYIYMLDEDGYLMPSAKDEPPPDPKLFEKYFKKK